MTVNLLILAGTIEASELAQAVATKGYRACLSYAGRVERPKAQPIEKRIGGFGGAQGLFAYLKAEQITHVIDATHPFAAQMSENAVLACAKARVPLLALTRPAWRPEAADQWQSVPDIPAAAAALPAQKQNVMLAIGRMHLDLFAAQAQHHYLLRLVDPPAQALALPDSTVIVSRGPFSKKQDIALMREHEVEIVVSKNAGGSGAYAKIEAARQLSLPVIMIERPILQLPRDEAFLVTDAMDWIAGH